MQNQDQQTIVVNVNLTRGVVAVLIVGMIVVAFIASLSWGQQKAEAAAPETSNAAITSSSGLRKYYSTLDAYSPTMVTQACASGYHFASLWELIDPSNLEYAGEHPDAWSSDPTSDMGEGPSTGSGGLPQQGWIRTGHNSNTSANQGQANCANWTSTNPSHYGTLAGLTPDWTSSGPYQADISVWDISVALCDYSLGVWCVED